MQQAVKITGKETLEVQHDYVLVRPVKFDEQVRDSGIVVPTLELAQQMQKTNDRRPSRAHPRLAQVLGVGPGTLLDSGVRVEPTCKVGDLVICTGQWVEVVWGAEVLGMGTAAQVAAIVRTPPAAELIGFDPGSTETDSEDEDEDEDEADPATLN